MVQSSLAFITAVAQRTGNDGKWKMRSTLLSLFFTFVSSVMFIKIRISLQKSTNDIRRRTYLQKFYAFV
ncbi:hypothetical protein ANTQUA_LOCUS9101 [Anthophora quadrimaculata]